MNSQREYANREQKDQDVKHTSSGTTKAFDVISNRGIGYSRRLAVDASNISVSKRFSWLPRNRMLHL